MRSLVDWVGAALTVASAPVVFSSGYLATLAFLARREPEGKTKPAAVRFEIIVPAHNEELGIGRTIRSLLAIDYPASLRRVIVVADNCTDATAKCAEEAGAEVIQRNEASRRGKGYALDYAFKHVEQRGWADAVVVVDADTSVSPNLLWEFARAIERGAHAMQADYGVRNTDESWRTRLLTVAFAIFHGVRSLARQRLGLSTGLRGNGMAFTREVLARVPHDAYSVVEDLEYGLKLGMAGIRVHYLSHAHVSGDMASDERSSRSQRRRWESGRRAVRRAYGTRLLMEGIRKLNPVLLDLWLDLVVPPLSTLVLVGCLGTAAAGFVVVVAGQPSWIVAPWLLSLGCLSTYVLRGVAISGTGFKGVVTLLWAPAYVVWKLVLAARRRGSQRGEWVRTARKGESSASPMAPPS